jgi:hypothetical protein
VTSDHRRRFVVFCVAATLVLVFSLAVKVSCLHVGAPYVTIDDNTTYEGGFLVWFGQAPPQRMYLESWINGATSLATYVAGRLAAGDARSLGLNVVADAYRDFYGRPERYVAVYRLVMLAMDLLTAWLVYLVARRVCGRADGRWPSLLAAGCYLLSYNSLWCYVVARPDTAVTLFAALGLYLYYRSDFGERRPAFWLAALAFGVAAGLKLHAAFFVVFAGLDLARQCGWRAALRRGWPFVVLAVAAFAVAAGLPLFDPLLYVKLRGMNAKDDASPWIHWGEQFVAILRGTGWLVVPVVVWGLVAARRSGESKRDGRVGSLYFLAVCWLVLFALIRQLRPYWMLPALPLFYVAAAHALARSRRRAPAVAVGTTMVALLAWQFVAQGVELRSARYPELRAWVTAHVKHDEPMFILGYEALNLPKNTACIRVVAEGLQRRTAATEVDPGSFTQRHLRNWEEEAGLTLFSLLDYQYRDGYTYYSYYGTPLEEYAGLVDLADIRYLLVQEHFPAAEVEPFRSAIANDFVPVANVVGPGGGADGLPYRILARKSAHGS